MGKESPTEGAGFIFSSSFLIVLSQLPLMYKSLAETAYNKGCERTCFLVSVSCSDCLAQFVASLAIIEKKS